MGGIGSGVSLDELLAEEVEFDNSSNGFVATTAQAAIEEVQNNANVSASPGFSFGKSGNLSSNTYLNCEGVPSNISGRYVYINSAAINRVFIAVQNSATFDVRVYYHDGNGSGLTTLGTVSVVASTGGEFSVSWAVPTGKQLAMRIVNGSAKNAVGGLELEGTT